MDFELHRNDLHTSRFLHNDPPSPDDGEALLRVESFGLTSNNITYAVFGEAMSYWNFFPASDPESGKLNVWGYAHVEDSRHPDVAPGMRVYGYLPCASHLLVVPDRVNEKGFVDAAPHRATLPSAYQGYRDVETDPVYSADLEAEHILFFPLFFTSFLIDDFLADEGFFGTDTIVISSASSKTAIIAAYLLAKRKGIETVGLTSASNREFVEELNVYSSVYAYDQVSQLPGERAVYVDISGDGAVRSDIHAHYGDRLAHSAAVGMTHWTEMAQGTGDLTDRGPSSSSPRTGSRSVTRIGARRNSTRMSLGHGRHSRNGHRIGFALNESRATTTSSGCILSSSTERSTQRRALSWICEASQLSDGAQRGGGNRGVGAGSASIGSARAQCLDRRFGSQSPVRVVRATCPWVVSH